MKKSRPQERITVGDHTSIAQKDPNLIFGHGSNPKADGIHLEVKEGMKYYTQSIINSIKRAQKCPNQSETSSTKLNMN